MSVLDLTSLLTLSAPEALSPPDPPVTPEIDTSSTSTADSGSSGSSGSADQSAVSLFSQPTAQQQVAADLFGAKLTDTVNPYESADEEAAAALVDLSGASSYTVDEFEISVPPNLAAASSLLDEVTSAGSVSTAAMGSLYTLMSSSAALALTS
jgi:hypothetical protein